MFEKKKTFSWKIPVLVLAAIIIVGSGVYAGLKIKDSVQEANKKEQVVHKDVFALNDNCEIWVQGQITSEGSYKSPKMLGTIPKDLLNKSKDEIESYFATKYPNKEIVSMNEYEIILCNTQSKEPGKANKYSIEQKDGFVYMYKYDKEGVKNEVEKTSISVDSLPKSVQDELSSGIVLDNEDDAYSRLENFQS